MTPHIMLMFFSAGIAGGIAGASLARVIPREIMRVAVVVVGALRTVFFAWRYWF